MINQQYSTSRVPDNWSQIMNLIEKGYSVKMTRNSKVVAMLVPVQNDKPQNFWQALQTFRQQVELSDFEPDADIFTDLRDRSPGREVLL